MFLGLRPHNLPTPECSPVTLGYTRGIYLALNLHIVTYRYSGKRCRTKKSDDRGIKNAQIITN